MSRQASFKITTCNVGSCYKLQCLKNPSTLHEYSDINCVIHYECESLLHPAVHCVVQALNHLSSTSVYSITLTLYGEALGKDREEDYSVLITALSSLPSDFFLICLYPQKYNWVVCCIKFYILHSIVWGRLGTSSSAPVEFNCSVSSVGVVSRVLWPIKNTTNCYSNIYHITDYWQGYRTGKCNTQYI